MIKNHNCIPYNHPHVFAESHDFTRQVYEKNEFAGGGYFTQKCHVFFNEQFGFQNSFLTSSCSSALSMAATICNFKPGDEVIMPSFGYVTMATAFHQAGAKIVFADCEADSPHISPEPILGLITPQTKAIVIVHYAGQSCDMEPIVQLVRDHNLILIEDCAHAINTKYKDQYVGTFGHLSTFSFHETKNIHCGEGGLLVVNDPKLLSLSRTVWQEGTNRFDFLKGGISKYEWVSQGSSYQPPEISASFLLGQLTNLNDIQETRNVQWSYYFQSLSELQKEKRFHLLPIKPGSNGHIFPLLMNSETERNELINWLKATDISATFHYSPLHLSPFWLKSNKKVSLKNTEKWFQGILRLPLYYSLNQTQQDRIVESILSFFDQ